MNEKITLDQKLKAIELAVAILGPVRKTEDNATPEAFAEVMNLAISQYGQIATTILDSARMMKDSSLD